MAINIIAAAMILAGGQLLGDLAGEPLRNAGALIATTAALCGSIGALLVVFNSAIRLRTGLSPLIHNRERIGLILAVAQVAFILYVQQTGLFIAGSAERGGSAASAFWVLLNIDALLVIYYGDCRDTRLFKLNLALWVVSFVQRGWFAYLFLVVGLESFRAIRKRQVTLGKLCIVIVLLAAFPILDLLKIYIRVSDVVAPAQALNYVNDELSSSNFRWFESLADTAEKIVSRIQVVSHAQVIIDNAAHFHGQVAAGRITPFWTEGVLGIIWDRQAGNIHAGEPAQALANFIAPNLDSSWNVNPSLLGWLTIHGEWMPLALLYLAVLCGVSIMLAQLVDQSESLQDSVWFIWLVFLIPGWIAQFVSFVLALGVYLALASVSRLRWIPAKARRTAPTTP